MRAPTTGRTDRLPAGRTPPEVEVALRRSTEADLDFVIALERSGENSPFIRQWSPDEHRDAFDRVDREHWIVTDGAGDRLGYIILYDRRAVGRGVYVKRIVIDRKSSGVGRRALALVLERAFSELHAELVSLAVLRHNERAQRAYRAAGFTTVDLSDAELRRMWEEVDSFSEECLVMVAHPVERSTDP